MKVSLVALAVLLVAAGDVAFSADRPATEAKVNKVKDDNDKGIAVNGVLFDPIFDPPKASLSAQADASVQIRPTFRVTNTTDKEVYLYRFGFNFTLTDPQGRIHTPYLSYYAKSRARYEPKLDDFMLLRPHESATVKWDENTPPAYPEDGPLFLRSSRKDERGREAIPNRGLFRFFAISDSGKYQLVIEYQHNTENVSITDPNTSKDRVIPTWKGVVKSTPIQIDIVKE